jgi:Plant transposon protein
LDTIVLHLIKLLSNLMDLLKPFALVICILKGNLSYVDENLWIIEEGLYLLVDGGHHKWRIMQCPLKHTNDEDKIRRSEFAEAMRKHVECSFGILQNVFSS